MLMLHISDIHFKSPDCLDQWMDPDFAIRTRMMRDLTEQVQNLGKVGAILVGGDVAFKAAPDEYQTARGWIQQLSEISGCPKKRVFVVPGNHDVDRAIIKGECPNPERPARNRIDGARQPRMEAQTAVAGHDDRSTSFPVAFGLQ